MYYIYEYNLKYLGRLINQVCRHCLHFKMIGFVKFIKMCYYGNWEYVRSFDR